MSDVSQNEQLFSALVDGELKGAERARAEKLLAEYPQSQSVVQQWRRQSAAIKSLPRFQLDPSFAARVMSAVSEKSRASTGNLKGPLSQWRTGFAAIITLAAMLLLTLFVFPRATEKIAPLASNVPVSPTAELRDSDVGGKFKSDSPAADVAVSPTAEPGGLDVADKVKSGSVPVDLREPGASLLSDAPQQLVAQESAEPPIVSEGMQLKSGARSRSAKDYSPEDPSGKLETGQAPQQMAKTLSSPAFSGVAAASDSNARRTSAEPVVEEPAVNEPVLADFPRPAPSGSTNQDAVNQVFFVDFRANSRSLEAVSEVLAQNQIQVVQNALTENLELAPATSNDGSGARKEKPEAASGETQSKFATLNSWSNQSVLGLEAFYVVATPSQMRQAIQQLSNQAPVSGYQVPQQQALVEMQIDKNQAAAQVDEKAAAPLGTGFSELGGLPTSGDSMSGLVRELEQKQTPSLRPDSGSFRQDEQLGSTGLRGGGRGGADRQQSASATQLRPYESNNQPSRNQQTDSDSSYPIRPDVLIAPPAPAADGQAALALKSADQGSAGRSAKGSAVPSEATPQNQADLSQAGNVGNSAANQEAALIDELFSETDSAANSDETLRKYLLLVRTTPTAPPEPPTAPAKKPD